MAPPVLRESCSRIACRCSIQSREPGGASENHNRIAANVLAALLPAARTARCRVVGSDQKLQPGSDLYYYPGVQVLGDPTDNDPLVKRRPCVTVEVSGERTEAIDRREVTVHVRDVAGTWQTRQTLDLDAIPVGCLGGYELSRESIYQDVLPA